MLLPKHVMQFIKRKDEVLILMGARKARIYVCKADCFFNGEFMISTKRLQ